MSLPDKELKQKMIEYATENPIVSLVCKKFGVHRSTYYRWIEKDRKFKKAFLKAQQQGKAGMYDAASARMTNLMNNSDPNVAFRASKYVLDHTRLADETSRHFLQDGESPEERPVMHSKITFVNYGEKKKDPEDSEKK